MWNNKHGFSFIEASIAMFLLSGIIIFSTGQQSIQLKSRSQRMKQSILRYLAIQVTQHINANWALFPPFVPPDPSSKVVYVGCADKNGKLINNYQLKILSNFNELVETQICDNTKTHFEIRFFWQNIDSNEVKINILTKNIDQAQSMKVHNYIIHSK